MQTLSAQRSRAASTQRHRRRRNPAAPRAGGPATFDDATFAVIGGTGRFSGVTGTYLLHQQPAPSGGTAMFTLDIKTSET